jgi:glutamyl-tRNA reductase
MHTVVIGVRHRTAPIEIREKLAFSQEETPDALREMMLLPGILEGAILSTCNRTEVYATVTDTELGMRSLKSFLSEYKQFEYDEHMHHAFILLHEDSVMHLFRVASGLDSLVLGEGQIMAQVKETLKTAMHTRSSGEVIEKIFKSALSVGKAVRSETGIANRDISVSRAAFEFALTRHPEFVNGKIAVLGAGKMAEILIASLKAAVPMDKRGDEQIVLVNRTPERVKSLSQKYGFPGYGWEELERVVKDYDTLFVATSSPHFVLVEEHFSEVTQPKTVIDISVPRNVDPVVSEMPHIALFNTDDLSGFCGYTGENRLRLIQQAHQIIEREYEKYHQWSVARNAAPMITQLRERVEDIRRNVVAELEAGCPGSQDNYNLIDELSRMLVNKILHDPTVRLRSTPQLDEIFHQAELLSRMFNIPAVKEAEMPYHATSAKVVSLPVHRK